MQNKDTQKMEQKHEKYIATRGRAEGRERERETAEKGDGCT